jgi:acyl-CoA synthetase (AMP-forming)/AMP-acid ligase II
VASETAKFDMTLGFVGKLGNRRRNSGHLENLLGSPTFPVIDLSSAVVSWQDRPEANLDVHSLELTARELAYIHYTSGSSRHPKGIMVEHRALRNALKFRFPCAMGSSVDMFSLCKLSISRRQNIVVACNPHIKCR